MSCLFVIYLNIFQLTKKNRFYSVQRGLLLPVDNVIETQSLMQMFIKINLKLNLQIIENNIDLHHLINHYNILFIILCLILYITDMTLLSSEKL